MRIISFPGICVAVTASLSITAGAFAPRRLAEPMTLPPGGGTPGATAEATLFVSGLEGGSGSTIGPGGALFVTESAAGRVSRVDPYTGAVTTFCHRPAEGDSGDRHRRADRYRVHRRASLCAGDAGWK